MASDNWSKKSQEDIIKSEHQDDVDARRVTQLATARSDFWIEVGKGNIEGYTPVFFTGYNEDLPATEAIIRPSGGLVTPILTAVTLDIVSDDANDTSAGTGARTILIIGLDDNLDEQSEVVTLNGTTVVTTALSYRAINFMQNATAGSNNVNIGSITAKDGSNLVSEIAPGDGRALQAIGTIPNGKSWFTGTFTPSAGKDDEVQPIARVYSETGLQFLTSKSYIYQNNLPFTNLNNVLFPEKNTISGNARRTGAAGTGRISLVLEFVQIDNDKF